MVGFNMFGGKNKVNNTKVNAPNSPNAAVSPNALLAGSGADSGEQPFGRVWASSNADTSDGEQPCVASQTNSPQKNGRMGRLFGKSVRHDDNAEVNNTKSNAPNSPTAPVSPNALLAGSGADYSDGEQPCVVSQTNSPKKNGRMGRLFGKSVRHDDNAEVKDVPISPARLSADVDSSSPTSPANESSGASPVRKSKMFPFPTTRATTRTKANTRTPDASPSPNIDGVSSNIAAAESHKTGRKGVLSTPPAERSTASPEKARRNAKTRIFGSSQQDAALQVTSQSRSNSASSGSESGRSLASATTPLAMGGFYSDGAFAESTDAETDVDKNKPEVHRDSQRYHHAHADKLMTAHVKEPITLDATVMVQARIRGWLVRQRVRRLRKRRQDEASMVQPLRSNIVELEALLSSFGFDMGNAIKKKNDELARCHELLRGVLSDPNIDKHAPLPDEFATGESTLTS